MTWIDSVRVNLTDTNGGILDKITPSWPSVGLATTPRDHEGPSATTHGNPKSAEYPFIGSLVSMICAHAKVHPDVLERASSGHGMS
ncbi:hypothetical protein ACIQF5_22060 [Streptomyces goshikiensis]|uniref:hypothetical protein n=1 Tax=Streptomyces goshikiensis TaxID=1942 RepID=UPI0037FBB44A